MKIKRLIIISSVLIVSGLLIAIIVLALNQFKIGDLDNSIISKTYDVSEDFSSIECNLEVSSLNIYYTTDTENKVLCLEKEGISFDVKVEDNILKIKENNNIKWYANINFINNTDVTIFINKKYLDNFVVNTSTGDISILEQINFNNVSIDGSTAKISFMAYVEENVNIHLSTGDVWINKAEMKNLDVKVTTGKIEISECKILNNVNLKSTTGDMNLLNNIISNNLEVTKDTGKLTMDTVSCNNVNVKSTTGDTTFSDVIVNNDAKIESSTGRVKLDFCDAKNIYIKTSTGDVSGSIMSYKIFNVKTDTGKINVPETIEGSKGVCNITTSTGDVEIYYN